MKTEEVYIEVSGPFSSTHIGSCNACNRYVHHIGVISHKVYEIDLRQTSFRLCPNCKDDLLAKLKKLDP